MGETAMECMDTFVLWTILCLCGCFTCRALLLSRNFKSVYFLVQLEWHTKHSLTGGGQVSNVLAPVLWWVALSSGLYIWHVLRTWDEQFCCGRSRPLNKMTSGYGYPVVGRPRTPREDSASPLLRWGGATRLEIWLRTLIEKNTFDSINYYIFCWQYYN